MKIALVQQHATADKASNLSRGLAALEEAARAGVEVAAFAELAFEPFYPQREAQGDVRNLAEPVPGPTADAIAAAARRLGLVVVFNLFERADDATYDCSPVFDADGTLLGRTRMIHITDFACFHERGYYAPGDTGAPVYQTRAGRIGVAICYDRHFPEYMRALALGGADLVVVPQAGAVDEWPEGLFEGEMQTAALQNGYFVALCNRVGTEERVTFAGESFVCGPDGVVRARAGKLRDELLLADIDLKENASSIARRRFLRERRPDVYGRILIPAGPPSTGAPSSESAESAADT